MTLETSELAAVKQMMASQQALSRSSRQLSDRIFQDSGQSCVVFKPQVESFYATFNFKRDPVFGEGGIYPNQMPNSVQLYLKAAAESLSRVEVSQPDQACVLHKIVNFLANLAFSEQEQRQYYMGCVQKLQRAISERCDALSAKEREARGLACELAARDERFAVLQNEMDAMTAEFHALQREQGGEAAALAALREERQRLMEEITAQRNENQQHVRNGNLQCQRMVEIRTAFEQMKLQSHEHEQLISQLQGANNELNEYNRRIDAEASLLRAKLEELTALHAQTLEQSTIEADITQQQLHRATAEALQHNAQIEELQAQLAQCRVLLKAKAPRAPISRQPSRLTETQIQRAQGSIAALGRSTAKQGQQAIKTAQEAAEDKLKQNALSSWIDEQDAALLLRVPTQNTIHDSAKHAVMSFSQSARTVENDFESNHRSSGERDEQTADQKRESEDSDSQSEQPDDFIAIPQIEQLDMNRIAENTKQTARSRTKRTIAAVKYEKAPTVTLATLADQNQQEVGCETFPTLQRRSVIVKNDKEIQTIITVAYIDQLRDDVAAYKKENERLTEKVARLTRKLQQGVRQHYKLSDEPAKGTVKVEFDEAAQEAVFRVQEELKELQKSAANAPESEQALQTRIKQKQKELKQAKLENVKVQAEATTRRRKTLFAAHPQRQDAFDGPLVREKQRDFVVLPTTQDEKPKLQKKYQLAPGSDFKDEYGINTKVLSPNQERRPKSEKDAVVDCSATKSTACEEKKQLHNSVKSTVSTVDKQQQQIEQRVGAVKSFAGDALVVHQLDANKTASQYHQIQQRKAKFESTLHKTAEENVKNAKTYKILQQNVQRGNERHIELDMRVNYAASNKTANQQEFYPRRIDGESRERHTNPLKVVVEFYQRKKAVAAKKAEEFFENVYNDEVDLPDGRALPLQLQQMESRDYDDADKNDDDACDEDSCAFAATETQLRAIRYRSPQEAAELFNARLQRLLSQREEEATNAMRITAKTGKPAKQAKKAANGVFESVPQNSCCEGMSVTQETISDARQSNTGLYSYEAVLCRSQNLAREQASRTLGTAFCGVASVGSEHAFSATQATREAYKNAFRHIGRVYSVQIRVSLQDCVPAALIDEAAAQYYPVINENAVDQIFQFAKQPSLVLDAEEPKSGSKIDFIRVLPEMHRVVASLKTIETIGAASGPEGQGKPNSLLVMCDGLELKSQQWTADFCSQLYDVLLSHMQAHLNEFLMRPASEVDAAGVFLAYLHIQYGLPFLADRAVLFLLANCYFYKRRSSIVELVYLALTGQLSTTHLIFLFEAERQLRDGVESQVIVQFFQQRFRGLRRFSVNDFGLPCALDKDQQRLAMLELFSLGHVAASLRVLELHKTLRAACPSLRAEVFEHLTPHLACRSGATVEFTDFMQAISFAPRSAFEALTPRSLMHCAQDAVTAVIEQIRGADDGDSEFKQQENAEAESNQIVLDQDAQRELLIQCSAVQDTIERRECFQAYSQALALLQTYQQLIIEAAQERTCDSYESQQ